TLQLTGGPGGLATYAWTGPNGFVSALQSPTISMVTIANAGTYQLIVTTVNGCSDTITTDVTIKPKPITSPIWHN
ncbi:MAG: hypothetical protein Q8M08_06625, partial [Bacteroidales bacterium]|nr:hypothetical protein [Bacteroidales bacterium]